MPFSIHLVLLFGGFQAIPVVAVYYVGCSTTSGEMYSWYCTRIYLWWWYYNPT
ncbi:hypothetical protein BDV40DRAFT_65046 [Aspergillus tamarii]|uniref:Uncharacterized protein n=1 Tax=Aspergillus tamarii TaxID=41984 RepID=A0A5N6UE41_ASPTM|nr:hypothetical protein BDV40DRAFT_65046 [Aspergillus tamarii]